LSIDEVCVDEFSALALPGGFGRYGYYEAGSDERVLSLIRAFDDQEKPIAAVCTGALILAKSGILSCRKATTYRLEGGKFSSQLSDLGADFVDTDLVSCGNIITSSGPSTAPAVALKLLEVLTSKEVAEKVRVAMGFPAQSFGELFGEFSK
jgi:4-methyl-5(b-hydroxyethyl)-thiazole monophosphate biosynthesis